MKATTKVKLNPIEVMRSIAKETAAAKPSGEGLPKGNELEQTIAPPEPPPPAPGEAVPPTPPPPEVKRPRGRPRKEVVAPPEPPPPPVDIITPAINGLIIPIIAKKKRRKPEDLMFNEQQMKDLAKMQPANDWSKPSWPAYIITALSIIMINIYTSDEIKPDKKELEKVVEQNPHVEQGREAVNVEG